LVGGIISGVKHLTTKKGEAMVFLQLEDPTGSAEVVVFSATYTTAREMCVTDRILVVKGRVDHKQQGETKLIALELTPFEAVAERRDVRFRIDARLAAAGTIAELARLVKEYPGESPVYVAIDSSLGARTLAFGPGYRVQPDSDFIAEAKALLGEASVA
jgi:DNA polymerase-3 subunit alpha